MGLGNGYMRPFGPWSGKPKAEIPLPPELAEGAAIIDSQSVKTTEKGGLGAMTQARKSLDGSGTSS